MQPCRIPTGLALGIDIIVYVCLLCCGAGGAQMFKDAEKGDKEVNIERTEQALDTKPEIIAAGWPFCNTMLHDGVKNKGKEGKVAVLDVAQLLAQTESL